MVHYYIYTDGSFGDNGETHGGVIFANGDGTPITSIHVYTKIPDFVSMRNVGGEIIAAWSGIYSAVKSIIKKNEESMETYKITFVYDYKGLGEWARGSWKTNKRATAWFAKSIKDMMGKVPNATIEYVWVKGHADNKGNNAVDKVASYDMHYVRANNIPVVELDDSVLLKEFV